MLFWTVGIFLLGMSFIIGTAGHIDHGKTSLVKALTGQDTDRLREEKERGISIDLGFAYLDLADGTRAGIIDVPGHERFIRNMIAGAHGIDLVLFVVAADDGVMPQTQEHFDIVELLGIQKAIFVITKADLVAPDRVADVAEQIEILTLDTALEGTPSLAFSSRTLQGLAELKNTIDQSLANQQRAVAKGYFRLPLDRAFLLPGRGLIVTGTAIGGRVQVGDAVRCLTSEQDFRVRSVEVHGVPVPRAEAGQRVALNLAGAGHGVVQRGEVISDPQLGLLSTRFDACVKMLCPDAKTPKRALLFSGTSQRLARLTILGRSDGAAAGKHVYCQLTLDAPLLVLRGDRFVMRDEVGARTIGGGTVLHPWAEKHPRAEAGMLHRLEALRTATNRELAVSLLDDSDHFALPAQAIHQFLGQPPQEVELAGLSKELVALGAAQEQAYTTAGKLRVVRDQVTRTLAGFHAAHPLTPGMELEEVRKAMPGKISATQFRNVIDRLATTKALARDGNRLRLAAHRVQANAGDGLRMARIEQMLSAQKTAPPDLARLVQQLGIQQEKLLELLRLLQTTGAVVHIGSGLYLMSSDADAVRTLLCRHLVAKGSISVAAFRDLIGSSRKYTIPMLEFFDREGTTKRVGDLRTLKSPTRATLQFPP